MSTLLHHLRDLTPLTPDEAEQIAHQVEANARMHRAEAERMWRSDRFEAELDRFLVARMLRAAREAK